MSIVILSEDSASSCDGLPEIDFAGAINKASEAFRIRITSPASNLHDSVDLTQEEDNAATDIQELHKHSKDGDWSSIERPRAISTSSETIPYLDPDDMFDQIYQKESQTDSRSMDSGVSSMRSTDSGVSSVRSTESGVSRMRSTDSGVSSMRSTDSGVTSVRSTDSGVSSMRSTESGVSSMRSTNSGVISRSTDSGVSSMRSMDSGLSSMRSFDSDVEPVDSGRSVKVVASCSGSDGSSAGVSRKKRKSVDGIAQPAKKTTALERAIKKQKLAEERAARQAAAEANKIYRPAECMKYMVIHPSPSLHAAWYMSSLAAEAGGGGAAVSPRAGPPGVLRWARRLPRRLEAGNGQVELSSPTELCERALLIYTAEETAPYVLSHTLSSHVAEVREKTASKLTLVVFGAKDYFKPSGRKKKSNDRMMTEIELEMAFTDLIVSADCDAEVANTSSELALLIMHFTKAIAEAPHKKAKRAYDEQAEFYMRGDNKNCIAIDKDGHGLSRLWQQMIAVLPMSSLEVSRAVCANYKTPLALYEHLQDSTNVKDLADIGVDRAGVPGAKSRRLGPEFARKLRTLLTAEDGDTLLD